jgi:hypothetical protein
MSWSRSCWGTDGYSELRHQHSPDGTGRSHRSMVSCGGRSEAVDVVSSVLRTTCVKLVMIACIVAMIPAPMYAQFSPGELSKAHQGLDGLQNCSQCHEIGTEIRGTKCLGCHTEIRDVISRGHGFHARNSSRACVDCHKEHLGRTAETVRFDRERFDHAQTGFILQGKHANTRCAQCHAKKNIGESSVRELITKTGRQTYLGLVKACVTCHQDVHGGTLTKECQTCHGEDSWGPASRFDHATTRFPLGGQHATVRCEQCHTQLRQKTKSKSVFLATRSFQDCSPCHQSPHKKSFTTRACNSCHSAAGWHVRQQGTFDHSRTSFTLTGQHVFLKCEQCHGSGSSRRLRLRHDQCMDCHSPYHSGLQASRNENDCAMCHTTAGFRPSNFTLARHASTSFPLSGAHIATLCSQCHVPDRSGRSTLKLDGGRCVRCHADIHRGQFSAIMSTGGCQSCHETGAWKPALFDHATTAFPLTGKHAQTACAECHRPPPAATTVKYRGTASRCQSCHEDSHGGQFMAGGETRCQTCHSTETWRQVTFDHNKQSRFPLDGSHRRVPCGACHHAESTGTQTIVRFKPLNIQCESCHRRGEFRNG